MLLLETQIIIAILLDQMLGDPRWFPHPVRFIGRLAAKLESFFRNSIHSPHIAGILTVATVLLTTILAAWGTLHSISAAQLLLGDIAAVFLLYTTIAAKDLAVHSRAVHKALQDNNLPEARKRVAMIVGRDTEHLDEAGIVRACVESVAENLADGVIAPLFYAIVAGPIGALAYKTINTMDSMFGYKNERYLQFGFAAARLDDLANYIPARATGLLIPIVAAILGFQPKKSLVIMHRDRRKHSSPNAGYPEAAMAGALGIQLGGTSSYFGKAVEKPTIGDDTEPLSPYHIVKANRLILTATGLAALSLIGLRRLILFCL